ncbi:MAG: ATP-binding protein [bacterium]|nr:ATP-binding protein [bacterium]
MIKRKLYNELKEHLKKKEITFIVGPRQAGKTTLMFFLKEDLEKKKEKTLFLNLDIESHKEFFITQDKLLKKIELEMGKNEGYVFIDEIQRKENASLFLKGIFDMNLPYKFIVSGSGSVELKEKIHESLAGRKKIFELSTISFEEFVNFKTNYKYENKLYEFFKLEKNLSEQLFEEYMNFGGYPKVILTDKTNEKLEIINEIYQSYLIKDISYLLKIHKIDSFTSLIKILSSYIGNLINYSEISSTIGISIKTLKDYIWYLEKTFIIKKISPYFKNIKKEIKKSPIIYFYDIGMKNFAIGIFGNLFENLKDIKILSFTFQNFVFALLKERLNFMDKIFFWRTKDKSEVDFIIDLGQTLIPIEVKYKKMQTPEIPRSLKNFIERYNVKKAYVVNLNLEEKIKFKNTEIFIVPYYYFLQEQEKLF